MRRDKRDEAFTDFVAARQNHLRRIAYAVCGDWHQANDIVQIALTKLYVAWPRVEPATAEAYARQIIMRTNLNERRRPRAREVLTLIDADLVDPGGLAYEERSALFEALQALPHMQRRTVLLRHWLGLSVAETARELDISEGTVKSHTARAVERLQGALTPPAAW